MTRFALFPIVVVVLSLDHDAKSQPFDFIPFATNHTQIPGAVEGATFSNLPLPSLRAGNVVFQGEGVGNVGIYAYRAGELEVLANQDTSVPNDSGTFSDFGSPSLDTEFNVAFRGVSSTGVLGVYTVVDGVVESIADTNTNIPGVIPQVTFSDVSDPWIENGNVVFRGVGAGVSGVYTTLGGSLRRVASTTTSIPDGTGDFTAFGRYIQTSLSQTPAIGGNTIAFYGEGSGGQQGIYAEINGSLVRIADTNTEIPDSGGARFPGFDVGGRLAASTYDDGVVFVAGLDSDPFPNRLGIYKWWNGQLMTIADQSTVVTETSGTLQSFGEAQGTSFYQDEYSFLGQDSSGTDSQGIFTIIEGQLIRVLANSDTLEGKSVAAMGSYGQGIEDGSVVFNIGNWGGGRANVAAIQEHKWLGLGSTEWGEEGSGDEWDDKANWSFGTRPRTVVPTVIAPDGAATIHGPRSDTVTAALELGGGNGVATLWMFSGVVLDATVATIHEKGVLAGEGRLLASVNNHGTIEPDDITTGTIINHGLVHVDATSRLASDTLTNHADIVVEGYFNTGNTTNNGYLRGEGELAANSLTNNGEVDVATLTLTDSLHNNNLLTVHRAFVPGDFENNAGGEIELRGDNARIDSLGEFHNDGVLRGSGRIVTPLFEAASTGEIRVSEGERLVIEHGPSSANAGAMEVIGGELEFKGDDQLDHTGSSALIVARDATLRFGGGLNNRGALAVSYGGADVFGDIDNQAAGIFPAGQVVLTGNSSTTFYGDFHNDGLLQVSAGSSVVFLGDFTGASGVSGPGEVLLEGDLRPGNSPAELTFGGDLHFGGLAGLDLELGGLQAGTEYDRIVVNGNVDLGGMLSVSLLNSFTLSPGMTFDVLEVDGQRSGTFLGLDEGALVGMFDGIELLVTYSAGDGNDVALYATSGLDGDYNNDGIVNLADYTVWRNNLGALEGTLLNAADNGVVGHSHYLTWKANFGASLSPASTAERLAVPEPDALVLLCGFAIFAWHVNRAS
ncbi:hypothetical protein [Aeoliella sp.]|uniref:hypothetical protein n=1 Tax=Aeoliella sp. TaxID=2795800 RepID=UPI003CCB87A6